MGRLLQPAVYAHNTSPLSGTSDITPFFLVFGCNAPSPETLSLELPPKPLPPDHYAQNLILRMHEAHAKFQAIKSDIRRCQRELYDAASRDNLIPEGKTVYVRNDNVSNACDPCHLNLPSRRKPASTFMNTSHLRAKSYLVTANLEA